MMPSDTANFSARISDGAKARAATQVGGIELMLIVAATLLALNAVVRGVDVSRVHIYITSLTFSVGLSAGLVRSVRLQSKFIWTPLFWWRLTMIAYSGVGTLLPIVSSVETLEYVNQFFEAYPNDSARYCLVFCLFSLFLLLSVKATMLFNNNKNSARGFFDQTPCSVNALAAGLILCLVGLPFKILIAIYPLLTGSSIQLPGAITSLDLLMTLGYAVIAGHYSRARSKKVIFVILLASVDGLIWILHFNKSLALFPFIMVGLGILMYRFNIRNVIIISFGIFGLYAFLTPLTNYGRAIDWQGGIRQPQLSRSLEIYGSYFTDRNRWVDQSNINLGWARIAYFPPATFAISQYDQGLPGNSLEIIPIALIPRVIWPDKPVITSISNEFNQAATGSDTSASSPGIPAEAYWNYGWTGVIVVGAVMGFVFAFWSLYSMAVLTNGAWHLIFVSILGIRAGIRIDGFVGVDIVPAIVMAIIGHFGLSALNLAALRYRRVGASEPSQPAAA